MFYSNIRALHAKYKVYKPKPVSTVPYEEYRPPIPAYQQISGPKSWKRH